MKNLSKFFASIIAFAFMVGLATPALAAVGVAPVVTLLSATALTVWAAYQTTQVPFVHRNGVEVEFWVKYIIDRLWKDNQFLTKAYSDDQYVIGGKIVHIPQPGSLPSVVKGRTVFPAAAVRRTDTDILYALEEYSTDPTHIQNAEKVELSYSKIDSVLGDHAGALNELVANDMINKWLALTPQANIIATSGAATAVKIAGQTGTRLAAQHTDLKKARLKMNLQNVLPTERYALIEENMMDEIVDSLSATQYKDFSMAYDAKTGIIGKLYGFDIMTRSSVAISAAALNGSNQLVVNALGAATAATDQVTSVCWQKNSVTRALGEVKFFEKLDDPQFYGDVYSALLRMGGRRRRADDAGVVVIRQA